MWGAVSEINEMCNIHNVGPDRTSDPWTVDVVAH